MQEKVFGLVGKSISYSFSPDYFNEKFRNLGLKDHTYKIFDLQSIDLIEELKQVPEIAGLNVTIPYKQAVIPYLDELHDSAYDIGAVNTIKIVDGKWIGYNTDYLGFEDVLDLAVAKIGKPKRAIILGSGGASNAVQYVLEKRKISYITISRKGIYTYENISDEAIANSQLIINTTPLGTYPNIEESRKIDY